MSTFPNQSQALMLIADGRLSRQVEEILNHVGFQTKDNFHEISDYDLVIIDSFFLKSGMAQFIEHENPTVPITLVLRRSEVGDVQVGWNHNDYETFIVSDPPSKRERTVGSNRHTSWPDNRRFAYS